MARLAGFILVVCVLPGLADETTKNREAALKDLAKGEQAYQKRDYAGAIKWLDKCLALDAGVASAYDIRGNCYFMKGKFKESVANYDQFLKLEPKQFNSHWRRGIALYHLGKYEEGKKQFEGHEKFPGAANDVENAVWHLMCAARKDGLEKARKGMLTIGKDGRVPMMEVYDLFKGIRKPEEIMKVATAEKGTEEERKANLFYAHLYLGLYFDLVKEKKKAIEHLKQASGVYKRGYMGEVARIHLQELQKAK